MSRGLSSGQVALLQPGHRIIVPLVELIYDSGTLRLALCTWDVLVGSTTFIGAGSLAQIDRAQESASSIQGLTMTLSGLSPAIVALATQEPYQGRVARILKAYLNPDTNEIVGAPVVFFVGRMRSQNIVEANDKASVTLLVEHYDAEYDRPWPLRFSDSDQQRLFPGDRGCEYAGAMVEREIIWPSKEALKK